MEELVNAPAESISAADQLADAVTEGWDADTTPAPDDIANESAKETEAAEGQTPPPAAPEAKPGTEPGGQTNPEGEGTDDAGTPPPSTPPKTYTVKHLGETKVLTEADVTPELLQKGLDYDRIRGRLDEAKPALDLIESSAKDAGKSVSDYVHWLRVQAKMASGSSEEEAAHLVDLEDRERAVSAKEAAQQEQQRRDTAGGERVRQDLAEFARVYPDVYEQMGKEGMNAVPTEVWQRMSKDGLTLVTAYSLYAKEQAEAKAKEAEDRAAAEVQNQKNAGRSTGSMASAGNKETTRSIIDAAWDATD